MGVYLNLLSWTACLFDTQSFLSSLFMNGLSLLIFTDINNSVISTAFYFRLINTSGLYLTLHLGDPAFIQCLAFDPENTVHVCAKKKNRIKKIFAENMASILNLPKHARHFH